MPACTARRRSPIRYAPGAERIAARSRAGPRAALLRPCSQDPDGCRTSTRARRSGTRRTGRAGGPAHVRARQPAPGHRHPDQAGGRHPRHARHQVVPRRAEQAEDDRHGPASASIPSREPNRRVADHPAPPTCHRPGRKRAAEPERGLHDPGQQRRLERTIPADRALRTIFSAPGYPVNASPIIVILIVGSLRRIAPETTHDHGRVSPARTRRRRFHRYGGLELGRSGCRMISKLARQNVRFRP